MEVGRNIKPTKVMLNSCITPKALLGHHCRNIYFTCSFVEFTHDGSIGTPKLNKISIDTFQAIAILHINHHLSSRKVKTSQKQATTRYTMITLKYFTVIKLLVCTGK